MPAGGWWTAPGGWTAGQARSGRSCWQPPVGVGQPVAVALGVVAFLAPTPTPASPPHVGLPCSVSPIPQGGRPQASPTARLVFSALRGEGQGVCRESLGPNTGPVQHPPEGSLPRSGVWSVRPGPGRPTLGLGVGGASARAFCIHAALPCPPVGSSPPPGRIPAWPCRPGWLALGVCCGACLPGRRLLGHLVPEWLWGGGQGDAEGVWRGH